MSLTILPGAGTSTCKKKQPVVITSRPSAVSKVGQIYGRGDDEEDQVWARLGGPGVVAGELLINPDEARGQEVERVMTKPG